MPTIFLTPGNLRATKEILRRELPMQSSAHLTEVLAAGAGFNTHAALLKAIASTPSTTPALIELDLARMSVRCRELDGPTIDFSFISVVTRSPKLPERLWIEYKTGDFNANRAWFFECRRRGIPMVFIEMRRKYARLNWDCITIDAAEDAHVHGKSGNDLGALMFKIFQTVTKNADGKPFFDASAMTGHVDRLGPELAYDLADNFFSLLYRPRKIDVLVA